MSLPELTEEDVADRTALKALFDKRAYNPNTKAGFFYFEDQGLMIAEGRETFVLVARDVAVGLPLFVEGALDFPKFEQTMALLDAQGFDNLDVLWDIGANIGPICVPAISRGYMKRAVAFEPEAQLFKLLRSNAILNEVDEKIVCIPSALGATEGTGALTLGENNTGDYRMAGLQLDDDFLGEATRETQTVAIRPMDDFADHFEPGRTLLWMDVQGFEGFVLQGAAGILAHRPPLVTEFWPYGLKRAECYPALRAALCSGAYARFADLAEETPAFGPATPERLDALYEKTGEGGAFTDLLFL